MSKHSTFAAETSVHAHSDVPEQSGTETSALRKTISSHIARRCTRMYGESLRAIILTGSLARDEATLIPETYGWSLLGDVEFLLIFHDGVDLPRKAEMAPLRGIIEDSISKIGIAGQVSLSAAHVKYLRDLRPDIFAYELRNCGCVVWGSRKILENIPYASRLQVPPEDGWRLLSNRMIEHLETIEELRQNSSVLSRRTFYRTVKLYLDMATSLLVFAGEYAPTYSERAQRLAKLAETPPDKIGAPFDLSRFSERIMECTKWKTSQNNQLMSLMSENGFAWWQEAVQYAIALWRWELEQLTHDGGEKAAEQLLKSWMKRQPLSRRLIGWMYVVRDQGWHHSWRNWPRWVRLAWSASPRYWVYGATNEIFSRAPGIMQSDGESQGAEVNWDNVRCCLPVVPNLKEWDEIPNRSRLVKEVEWNYATFLEGTRA